MGRGAVGLDHGDFTGGGALRHIDVALDAAAAAVGGHAVAGVAAAVLHHAVHADGLAVGHQYCSAPVLIGQGGHKIVHLQQHVFIQPDQGRHALSQGDVPPTVIGQGHIPAVAEHAPDRAVDFLQIKFRRLPIQLPKAAAGALRRPGGHRGSLPADRADKVHGRPSGHGWPQSGSPSPSRSQSGPWPGWGGMGLPEP